MIGPARRPGIVGWDIGGVNTKVARVAATPLAGPSGQPRRHRDLPAAVRPYEIQRDPAALPRLLTEMADEVGAAPDDIHAVTMTAELSQLFRFKRDGVAFILDAVAAAFPNADVRVFAARGEFLSPTLARSEWLAVAAANWAATARAVARLAPDAILIDIGTTTTDIVPVAGGQLVAEGWTDPERLRSGELLYLGAVRTPVEAIVSEVPLHGGRAGVSAEGFALSGDVHVWRGALAIEAYVAPTPDGRPATRPFAGERLARVVCADGDLVDDAALDRIADAIAATQVSRTADAIAHVRSRHPDLTTAIVTGVGDFLAAAAATQAGLEVRWLAADFGPAAARGAPAASVALLCADAVDRSLSKTGAPW